MPRTRLGQRRVVCILEEADCIFVRRAGMSSSGASPEQLQEYRVVVPVLPLYDSPLCTRLATQAWEGRHLVIVMTSSGDTRPSRSVELPHLSRSPIKVTLCEDGYQCWLAPEDLDAIVPVPHHLCYRAQLLPEKEVRLRTALVIDFVMVAYKTENSYLWGGTCGPNYDCSGLVQRAFAAAGIWVPRDAYQQEGFAQRVPNSDVQTGDLVFFGSSKATHVGIILDDALPEVHKNNSALYGPERLPPLRFIHSSGKEHGHGRIEVDNLGLPRGPAALHFCSLYRGAGRVLQVFSPP